MKKRGLALVIAGALAVGTLTGLAYARSANFPMMGGIDSQVERRIDAETNFSGQAVKDTQKNEVYKDMIKMMRENGYKDAAKAMEKNDYKAMDEFMNNMTDEDYKNMIKIMRENGYGDMADMMESMGREYMVRMHNAMGGAEDCHSGYSGMMGSF